MVIFDPIFGIYFLPVVATWVVMYIQQSKQVLSGRAFRCRYNEVGYQALKSRHDVPGKSVS